MSRISDKCRKANQDGSAEENLFVYSVIELEDGGVDAVPTNWLDLDNKYCFWPPKALKQVSSLVKNCVPPSSNWEKYPITVIKQYGSLVDAKRRVDKIILESEYSSSQEEFGRGKRKKIPYSKLCTFQPLHTVNYTPPTESPEQEQQTIPATLSSPGTSISDNVDNVTNHVVPNMLNTTLSEMPMSFLFDNQEIILKLNALENAMQCLIKEFAVLKIDICETRNMVKQLIHENTSDSNLTNEDPIIQLPVENQEEFLNLESSIIEEDHLKSFVNQLKILRGGKTDDFVRRMLDRVFSRDFATKVAWTSAKNNVAVGTSDVMKNMELIARKFGGDTSYTPLMFKTCVSNWLRNASNRLKKMKC